ncbi:hypothetical protein BRADI_2g22700v3 [Brachypodium distachyon]|uniref:DUF1618 domain-containing protein n=1 Tax=Brachypodium distachyon TaxID=15368 RepID=I1HIJ8_BRADI|nr:hypothetical protein BRADI_2g22700v3 [Brachypodium distachyon]
MSLRRLLGLSTGAAVSGHYLRRSISTAASRPPWALFEKFTPATGSALGASVRIVEPPRVSSLLVPALHVRASAAPDPGSGVSQALIGHVSSTSGDGLLLITIYDMLTGASNREGRSMDFDLGHLPPASYATRFICNPLTGRLSRLPDIGGPWEFLWPDMGFLTKADRGHGPPDGFAVAQLDGNKMIRFLSETGKWDITVTAPYQLPLARRMMMDQEALALGGRLWWVDQSWGVVSADPFSDQPEPRFVELPRGSVLPAPGKSVYNYRRVVVSEGKLRYAEVWQREPFVLSTFVLDDDEGGGC